MRPLESLDDATLLARVREQPEAFGVFYRRHAHAVLAYLARRSPPDTAAELTAETFAAALLGAGRYWAQLGEPVQWLFGIARNKLHEAQRRGHVETRARRRLGIARLELDEDDFERIEQLASLDGTARLLHDALDELPRTQRDALLARVVREQPYEAIAADAGISSVLARQRVTRALRTLRHRLGGSAG